MRNGYRMLWMFLPIVMLAMAGCGSGGSGSQNPFSTANSSTGVPNAFKNISTASGKTGITVEVNQASVGTGSGQVVATATIVGNGQGVAGIPVSFRVDGPATIDAGQVTASTDSNGVAVTRITVGTVSIATNVIVTATAALGTQTVSGTTTFVIAPDSKVLSYKLTLSAVGASGDGTTVGPGSTVIATAQLSDKDGNPIANQAVTFAKVDPASPVIISSPVVKTDSNGTAINFLKADNLPSTASSSYDVILAGSAVVNGDLVTSVTIFKIVRSAGNVIKFLTTKSPTDPDGTLNQLSVVLKAVDPADQPSTGVVQLVPFQVLDHNGVPIPRQPVAVGIYSIMGGSQCTAIIDNPEGGTTHTVTTDDNGKGIFNAVVSMATPPIGSENSCSIIYRATTVLDGLPEPPVFSYGGFVANVKNERPL